MLRRLLFAAALAVAAPLAAVAVDAVPAAHAQPGPYGFDQPAEDQPGSMKRPEHLTARPSGFWTSNRPAAGGAYRYRIMGMGALALAITLFFLIRLLRRVSAARPALARK